MKWRFVLTCGVMAGVALAARRRVNKGPAEGDLWSAATDPVAPSGDA